MTVLTQAARLIPAVNALGIDSVDAVKRGEIDAAVYLLDQAGAGFGYRYEWERYGPFSETLAADLVELTDEDLGECLQIDSTVTAAAAKVRELIEPGVPGVKPFTWIRLLASLDFLQRFAGRRLHDGPHPPYIESNFEQPVIAAAVARLRGFA